MARAEYPIADEIHANCGKQCFNQTWELLEKPDRSDEDNDMLLHTAHCSRYHWQHVGQPKHFARGDWLLSRVYAVLGCGDLAIHYAQRCRTRCDDDDLSAFDKAYANEALARGLCVSQQFADAQQHIDAARALAPSIDNEQERQWLLDDLDTIRTA